MLINHCYGFYYIRLVDLSTFIKLVYSFAKGLASTDPCFCLGLVASIHSNSILRGEKQLLCESLKNLWETERDNGLMIKISGLKRAKKQDFWFVEFLFRKSQIQYVLGFLSLQKGTKPPTIVGVFRLPLPEQKAWRPFMPDCSKPGDPISISVVSPGTVCQDPGYGFMGSLPWQWHLVVKPWML